MVSYSALVVASELRLDGSDATLLTESGMAVIPSCLCEQVLPCASLDTMTPRQDHRVALTLVFAFLTALAPAAVARHVPCVWPWEGTVLRRRILLQ